MEKWILDSYNFELTIKIIKCPIKNYYLLSLVNLNIYGTVLLYTCGFIHIPTGKIMINPHLNLEYLGKIFYFILFYYCIIILFLGQIFTFAIPDLCYS